MSQAKLSTPNLTSNKKGTVKSVTSFKQKLQFILILLVVGTLYAVSSYQTDSFITRFNATFFENVSRMTDQMWPPDMSFAQAVWPKLIETIHMAVIATTVASILCIPLSVLAARNIMTNKTIYNLVRFFLNVMRTIPELLLAVIFVSLFSIGVFPGILALIIFSLGILAKLISETIESIDESQIEVIRASGGNFPQVIQYAVLPQILPQFASFSLYVFEINIRASVVLGFVGAGGIGLLLSQQINFLFYQKAMAITVIIYVVVVIIDYISNKIREALL